ncbi:unnamed protein product [Rotaria magnacalcarata]|uniref:Uncharacterized protein n=1 Tax=Rotaria magnacalcarata TaxID=392030 RepID=A0A815L1D9_9BILA|nr:unnamed protein product [Rotaria magnacalcarata]
MNAALQQFNIETVNKHLKRCWNVIHGKYSAENIRSLSFIHLCCCHVMHAIARSLNAEKIEKKTREAVLYIFAYMLSSDDINQLYDTLGLVINIFGDPNEQNAKEKLDRICSLKLNIDEESESVLKDFDKIFRTAEEKEEELKLVDEYFESDEPIIHQSPFNKEAIKRYPLLDEIVIKKKIKANNNNTFFSASIMRIFYRWWAYLPLWTGLLFDFEERYTNDIEKNPSVLYYPIRYSNAVIESYFRTFKKSICQGKRGKPPQEVIMALHRSVKVQSKADQFGLTQSSKGRKRKKTGLGIAEIWKKRTHGKIRRSKYTNLIDKFVSKRARQKEDQFQPDSVTKKYSESKNVSTASSSNKSESSSKAPSEKISINESYRSSVSDSLSSSEAATRVIHDYSNDIPSNLDMSTNNDHLQNAVSKENNLKTNSSSIMPNNLNVANEQYKVTTHQFSKDLSIKIPSNPEIIISGFALKWPTFEIKNVMYTGQAYTLYNTCAIDSALFSLYFIYVTDEIISSELKEAADSSPYATLTKTFNIVEKEGWDAARIYWLLKCNILKTAGRLTRDLFGSVDELAFSFLKSRQRHSNEIICLRSDCPKKERKCTSTELDIFSTDENIDKFEIETEGVCPIMVKPREEISEAEALQKKYRDGCVPFFNCETNKYEYERGWICNSTNIHTSATFDYGHPPIIIVNIKLFSKRIDEGYEPNPVRLRDLKDTIRICSIKYKLRAVINHRDAHFTATLIGPDKELCIYDDRQGVRPTRTSPDRVEIAVYTQIYEYWCVMF